MSTRTWTTSHRKLYMDAVNVPQDMVRVYVDMENVSLDIIHVSYGMFKVPMT
jgi:hypothetical protein